MRQLLGMIGLGILAASVSAGCVGKPQSLEIIASQGDVRPNSGRVVKTVTNTECTKLGFSITQPIDGGKRLLHFERFSLVPLEDEEAECRLYEFEQGRPIPNDSVPLAPRPFSESYGIIREISDLRCTVEAFTVYIPAPDNGSIGHGGAMITNEKKAEYLSGLKLVGALR